MITRRSAVSAGLALAGFPLTARADDPPAAATPTTPPQRPHIELSGGKPITPDFRDIDPATGQQKGYVVLSPDERAKGFVRPVRTTYTHLRCGADTTMSEDIAETFARDPHFYRSTFCIHERAQFPLSEYVWKGTTIPLGT